MYLRSRKAEHVRSAHLSSAYGNYCNNPQNMEVISRITYFILQKSNFLLTVARSTIKSTRYRTAPGRTRLDPVVYVLPTAIRPQSVSTTKLGYKRFYCKLPSNSPRVDQSSPTSANSPRRRWLYLSLVCGSPKQRYHRAVVGGDDLAVRANSCSRAPERKGDVLDPRCGR
jgi:hypothetical protein